MKIYMIRHGEATHNINLNVCDETPNLIIPLTKKGYEQSQNAAKLLHENMERPTHHHPAVIFSSPYLRAMETTRIISGKCQHTRTIEDWLLVEQNFGIGIGCSSTENFICNKPNERKLFFQEGKLNYQLPQGESLAQVGMRAETLIGKILQRFKAHSTVIVVSHKSFCCMMHMQLLNEYDVTNMDWENGEVREYETFECAFFNYKGVLK